MNVGDGEGGGGVAGVGTMLVGCVQCVEGAGAREEQWLLAPTIRNRTYIDKQQLVHKQQGHVSLSVCNCEEDLRRECDGERKELALSSGGWGL